VQHETSDPLIATFGLSRSCDRLDDVELLDVGRQRDSLVRGASARASSTAWTISCTIFHRGDVDVVYVSGELDLAGRSKLDATLREVTAREVCLDISKLTFIDARGFSILQRVKTLLSETGHTVTVCGESECEPWVQRALVLISSVSSPEDSSAPPHDSLTRRSR
jgi:anti-anti-sigma factor